MSNLTLAMRARGAEGEPLPPVFRQLEVLGAKFRRGQVSLIAAAPGGGKSAVATHIVVNADYTGYGDKVPSLYFSADTDRHTLGVRIGASILQQSLSTVEEMLKTEDSGVWEEIAEATEHITFNFDPAPSLTDIDDEVEAYAVVHGEYPHLIVVDNLMNVTGADGEGTQQFIVQDRVIEWLCQIARQTGAAVIVLHHVKGTYEDGVTPIPFSGLMNNVGKRPRLVITLYRVADNLIGICVVKNSSGRADTNAANVVARVGWMPERSFFADGRNQ